MAILLLFIAIPLIEIGLFIQVGGMIGLWPTLGIVLLTAVVGTQMLRAQGQSILLNLQRSLAQMQNPTPDLAHGAMVIFGAAMLLTPGFFTDAAGLALMVPSVREFVFKMLQTYLANRVQVYSPQEPNIYEAEFEDVTAKPTHKPDGTASNWTRH